MPSLPDLTPNPFPLGKGIVLRFTRSASVLIAMSRIMRSGSLRDELRSSSQDSAREAY
jgi:hypothetical protein